MRRGEVWWAQLAPPLGFRPVVLVSRDAAYAARRSITVVPVTTRIRQIRSEVQLGPEDGLPRESVANADDISTVPISSLQRRVGLLDQDKLRALSAAIHYALALDD